MIKDGEITDLGQHMLLIAQKELGDNVEGRKATAKAAGEMISALGSTREETLDHMMTALYACGSSPDQVEARRNPIDQLKSCKTCRYCHRTSQIDVPNPSPGKLFPDRLFPAKCMRRSPGPEGWPRIWSDDWCGDYHVKADRYRHKTRGTTYNLVGAGKLQTKVPLGDMTELLAYVGTDGEMWFRTPGEFYDGRYEKIETGGD